MHEYTRDVIRALARQGSRADMIQIGNEVTKGMLRPLGQIYQADGEHWADFATLVRAGIAGARAGNPRGHRLRTMIAETQYPWTFANGDTTDNFVWTPDQLPDGDRFPGTPEGQAGTPNDNMTLFDFTGVGLPALRSLR